MHLISLVARPPHQRDDGTASLPASHISLVRFTPQHSSTISCATKEMITRCLLHPCISYLFGRAARRTGRRPSAAPSARRSRTRCPARGFTRPCAQRVRHVSCLREDSVHGRAHGAAQAGDTRFRPTSVAANARWQGRLGGRGDGQPCRGSRGALRWRPASPVHTAVHEMCIS